jgi:hypothetical protein
MDRRDTFPVALAVPTAKVSGKTQKQFSDLIERLKLQRRELAQWQEFRVSYHQQLAAEYQPRARRLREKRIAMAELLDRAVDDRALAKRERDSVKDILRRLLSDLLEESPDEVVVRLYDKYAHSSFAEEHEQRMNVMRELAEEAGIDVAAYEGEDSPEDLGEWLEEQVRAARAEPAAQQPAKRKKSAKALDRDFSAQAAAQGATQAVREIYRKLVSELHPDREPDQHEKERKTVLMQRVNKAYKSQDLMTLFELQLGVEQFDSAALTVLAEKKLRHYILVLKQQAQRLSDELALFIAPFKWVSGNERARKLTPAAVQRALDSDINALKAEIRKIDTDLLFFRDVRHLKLSIGGYRRDSADDDEWTVPEQFQSRRRGRRR